MEQINKNEYVFDNKFLINEVNTLLGTRLSNDEADTIGGLVYIENQELQVGDEIAIDGLIITILEKDENRYKRLKAVITEEQTEVEDEKEN